MESIGYVQDCPVVREAQGGNQAAFAQLVHTYDRVVLRLALRLTGSESDAQDIYQEAFLKIYQKLDGFRFECSFSTWIYRIVTNVCLDHMRRNRALKKNRMMEVNGNDLLHHLSDDRPGNNPEQHLLDRELKAQMVRALQRLTPRERTVFCLKHFHGLKLRTVSEILNISEGAVRLSSGPRISCSSSSIGTRRGIDLDETALLIFREYGSSGRRICEGLRACSEPLS